MRIVHHIRLWLLLIFIIGSMSTYAQMNNPYVDDKIVHFGFSLGLNFMGYNVTDINTPIDGEIYHARVSSLTPGCSVGFVTDLRLSRHLNLRFTPTLHFGEKTITYKTESGKPVEGILGNNDKVSVLALPIDIPLYLKWSAEREKNYRPYLIAGGGAHYDFGGDKEKPIYTKKWDFFVAFGLGCDLYMSWFKFCPEIRYQIGFNNVLTPVTDRPQLAVQNAFYTNALQRLTNQMITLTFNFE